jgi:hypothetical protein
MDTNKLAVRILLVALLVGILGDTLLREWPWGLNFTLWALVLAAFLAALAGRGRGIERSAWLWLVPVGVFAGAFAWRDSGTLQLLNILALMVAFSLWTLRAQGGTIRHASLTQYVLGSVIAALSASVGALVLLLGDIQWKEASSGRFSRKSLAFGRGLLLAVPPVLVFSGLLMSADAVFESLVKEVFRIDFATLLSHVVLTLFLAWIVGGYARGLLVGRELEWVRGVRTPSFSMGIVEISVILGALNLLFVAFVAVQFRYFFGGASRVQVTPDLTYAEYARSGFFELLTVVTLVLPLLLLLHWLLRKDRKRDEQIFQALAGFQFVMLAVIMASAFQRMRLYQREYGLTEQRLYPTAFMVWLAVVFVWFALTALRGRRERFACGAMVAGFALIAALHVLNPDALIVRVNAARAAQGREFDAAYTSRLSADAVSELLRALPKLPERERRGLARSLLVSWPEAASRDWRTWNYSRAAAYEAVRKNAGYLQDMACWSCPD